MDSRWRVLPCRGTEMRGHVPDPRPGMENRGKAHEGARRKERAYRAEPDDRSIVGESGGGASRKAAMAAVAPVP